MSLKNNIFGINYSIQDERMIERAIEEARIFMQTYGKGENSHKLIVNARNYVGVHISTRYDQPTFK